MNYYECHITMKTDAEYVEKVVESLGWKYSAIDGDPVLGRGVLQYATKHFPDTVSLEDVVNALNYIAFFLRYNHGLNVIRQKVELVVYDTKQTQDDVVASGTT